MEDALGELLGTRVVTASPCPGGDINRAWKLELADGRSAFLKSRTGAGKTEFHDEAAGIAWLAEPGGVRVPEVLAVLDSGEMRGLVLEWVGPGPALSPVGEEELGRGLAAIHAAGAGAHGVPAPGAHGDTIRFGEAVMPLSKQSEGGDFAAVYAARIEALAEQALEAGRIDADGAATISLLAQRSDSLCGPSGPPARLHGDLWSGNVMADAAGRPWLIDPAAYGGNREMDLSMLDLFGSISPGVLGAYEEALPLDPGWQDRMRLWQVQPLLVHAILFGGGYGSSAVRTADSYLS